jgi:uncharacterized protein (TIGR00290 family)
MPADWMSETMRSVSVDGRLALSWSGGKDSALTLWMLRQQGREPAVLLTTVTEGYERISMHGVRRTLLARQAEAAKIPLVDVPIPPSCSNEVYEQRLEQAFATEPLAAVETVAHGDLFLEDVRAYREQRLAATGRRGLFPLWGLDTSRLAHHFIEAGFHAILVCVDPRQLDPSFAGRPFDSGLLAELPASVDPCGENGEFHTFVHAGPIFRTPIPCTTGETVEREGFIFADLAPPEGRPAGRHDRPAEQPSRPQQLSARPSRSLAVIRRMGSGRVPERSRVCAPRFVARHEYWQPTGSKDP